MPLTTPLPTGFSEQIHELLPEEAPLLLRALDEEPSVSIRLNARKTKGIDLPLPLGEAVPWAGPWISVHPSPQIRFGMQAVTTCRKLLRCYSAL